MIFNLFLDDVSGGLSGPLKPSYDNIVPIILILVFVIIFVGAIIGMVIGAKKKKDENTTSKESIETLTAEEEEMIRKHREEFSNLSEEEKALIREHRENTNNKSE